MSEVEIYTDGACSGNPGPGGWAALLRSGEHEKELSGGEAVTTNQRMEMKAALAGLQALKWSCRVNIYSDSAYLINAFRQGWLYKWQNNGWRTAAGGPVQNRDLWIELLNQTNRHEVSWHKVAGHTGNPQNERCDILARAAARQASAQLPAAAQQADTQLSAAERPATNPVE